VDLKTDSKQKLQTKQLVYAKIFTAARLVFGPRVCCNSWSVGPTVSPTFVADTKYVGDIVGDSGTDFVGRQSRQV